MKKHLPKLAILLILLSNWSPLHSQKSPLDDITGTWGATEFISYRVGQDICQRYVLNVDDDQSGYLSMVVRFYSDDSRNNTEYRGMVPFSFTVLEIDTSSTTTLLLDVKYKDFIFEMDRMPGNQEFFVQPDHLSHLKELQQYISNRREEYRVVLEGETTLVIGGFSLVKDQDFVYFKNKGFVNSCDSLTRDW